MRNVLKTGAVALSVVLAGGLAAAHAADAPRPAPMAAPVYQAPAPLADWSGLYLGAHAGWGTGEVETDIGDVDVDGVLGGGLIGFNWQFDPNWVAGVEADFSFSGVDGSENLGTIVFGNQAVTARLKAEADWLATIRGRVGYAFDDFMLYGTGGIAFADVDVQASLGALTSSDSNTHVGWTIGGGLETRLAENITGRVEYLYYDFGEETYLGGIDADLKLHTVRAAVTYKFNM